MDLPGNCEQIGFIAYEKGFFEDEGLYVTLEPQANWKVILDRVITGELDGAHMLAGQPLAATPTHGYTATHEDRCGGIREKLAAKNEIKASED